MKLKDFLNKEGRGSSAALARKINVPPVLITQWKKVFSVFLLTNAF